MYQLLVYFPGSEGARARINIDRGSDVVAMIPKLLAEHEGCEHIVVMLNDVRLFAIDCAGNRLP